MSPRIRNPSRPRRAFTLVEIMIATGVFTLIMIGTLKIFIESYHFANVARQRDNARAVLNVFADRFLREAVPDDASTNPSLADSLWGVTTERTGRGLTFTEFDGTTVRRANPANDPVAPYRFTMPLGDQTSSTVNAEFFRYVTNLDESTGIPNSSTANNTRSGRLLSCTFTAIFTLNQRSETLSVVVVRCTK